MIEEIFTSKTVSNPIILEDCTLYIRLDPYPIGTTFIFRQQTSHKVQKFGYLYNTNIIRSDISNMGYFSSINYLDFFPFHSKLTNAAEDEIAIFGYSNSFKYIIRGINITKKNFGENYLARFSFSDYKASRIKL